jgi:hypothetical protein
MGDHHEPPQPHVGARRLQRMVLMRIEWQGRPTDTREVDRSRAHQIQARPKTKTRTALCAGCGADANLREAGDQVEVASIAVFGYWRFYHVSTVRPPRWEVAICRGTIGAIPRFRTAQDPIRRTADR